MPEVGLVQVHGSGMGILIKFEEGNKATGRILRHRCDEIRGWLQQIASGPHAMF